MGPSCHLFFSFYSISRKPSGSGGGQQALHSSQKIGHAVLPLVLESEHKPPMPLFAAGRRDLPILQKLQPGYLSMESGDLGSVHTFGVRASLCSSLYSDDDSINFFVNELGPVDKRSAIDHIDNWHEHVDKACRILLLAAVESVVQHIKGLFHLMLRALCLLEQYRKEKEGNMEGSTPSGQSVNVHTGCQIRLFMTMAFTLSRVMKYRGFKSVDQQDPLLIQIMDSNFNELHQF